MTVQKLIKRLSKFDANAEVLIASYYEGNYILKLSSIMEGCKPCNSYSDKPISKQWLQDLEDEEDWNEISEILGLENPQDDIEVDGIKKALFVFKETASTQIVLEPK